MGRGGRRNGGSRYVGVERILGGKTSLTPRYSLGLVKCRSHSGVGCATV